MKIRKRSGIYLKCNACFVNFYVSKYRKDTAKFCSLICQNKKQWEQHKRICVGCGNTFHVSDSRKSRKYCSIECRSIKALSNKETRRKSKLANMKRRGFGYGKTLRRYIFEYKKPICEVCGYSDYMFCLDMHHIDKNPNNNTLSNVAVLCVICHRKLHKGVIDYATEKRF